MTDKAGGRPFSLSRLRSVAKEAVPESRTPAARVSGRRSRGASAAPERAVSHNLNGQRLGRKGRDTRDRIIAAAQALLARTEPGPITLSAVAREASLGMTSLYLYFSDLTELLLAVLEPVMAGAEDAYFAALREHWPDEALGEHCHAFVTAYFAFWKEHSRVLHLRNSMADQHDRRMLAHRITSARRIIDLLVVQMDAEGDPTQSPAREMGTVLMTAVERVVTMATDPEITNFFEERPGEYRNDVSKRLKVVARLVELGIREYRHPADEERAA